MHKRNTFVTHCSLYLLFVSHFKILLKSRRSKFYKKDYLKEKYLFIIYTREIPLFPVAKVTWQTILSVQPWDNCKSTWFSVSWMSTNRDMSSRGCVLKTGYMIKNNYWYVREWQYGLHGKHCAFNPSKMHGVGIINLILQMSYLRLGEIHN
jgi:hypothetical protein